MTVVGGIVDAAGLVIDHANVYWVDRGDDSVRSAPKGGGMTKVLATMQYRPSGIAVDATHVYWSSFLGGAILRIDKAGVGPVQVVTSAPNPTRILLDETHVYFGSEEPSGANKTRRAKKTGGTAEVLAASGLLNGVADNYYYYQLGTELVRVNKSDPSDLVPMYRPNAAVLVADPGILWAPYTSGIVTNTQYVAGVDPKTFASLVPTVQWGWGYGGYRPMLGRITAMATDGCDVFITTNHDDGVPTFIVRNIVRLRRGDDRVEGIVGLRQPALALQADATHVYWLEKTRIARAVK